MGDEAEFTVALRRLPDARASLGEQDWGRQPNFAALLAAIKAALQHEG